MITMVRRRQQGFTLLEVLLVVAIIAILAGIVIIAINPGKNLIDTRNVQRQADVTTIVNAVYQYALDNGTFPGTIGGTATEICRTSTPSSTCTTAGLVDLSTLTSNGKYIPSIPIDPVCPSTSCTATNGTGYQIKKETTGRITVSAPGAEGKTITVTR